MRRGPSREGKGSEHPFSTPSTSSLIIIIIIIVIIFYLFIIYIFLRARDRPSTIKFETLGLSNKEV